MYQDVIVIYKGGLNGFYNKTDRLNKDGTPVWEWQPDFRKESAFATQVGATLFAINSKLGHFAVMPMAVKKEE